MKNFKFSVDESAWLIEGPINFDNVVQFREWGEKLIDESVSSHLRFDFSSVGRSDSSGLTLMLAWMRYAKSLNKSIEFVNVPSSLLKVGQACGVEELLPIASHFETFAL